MENVWKQATLYSIFAAGLLKQNLAMPRGGPYSDEKLTSIFRAIVILTHNTNNLIFVD